LFLIKPPQAGRREAQLRNNNLYGSFNQENISQEIRDQTGRKESPDAEQTGCQQAA
jgi:hypothetical protein